MANRVDLAIYKCVNSLSKFGSCEKCISACPTDAIQKVEGNSIPALSQIDCIECGACISTCPTEALIIPKFSPLDFIFKTLENNNSDEVILDCKKNIPCLASLSIEDLVSLVILKKYDIFANFGHCSSCDIFAKVGNQIDSQIQEANFFLKTLNIENQIILQNISDNQSFEKMDFQKRAIFDASIFKRDMRSFDSGEIAKAKNKDISNRRKLFLMSIQRVEKENSHILHSDDLTFLSQKIVDKSCTNCQICYRVCPTTALSSDYKNSIINFNSSLCVKCHLCHDVCETSSIQIREDFSIQKFLNRDSETLIEFDIGKCYECDSFYTKKDNYNLCPRCKIEEDEAKELWNI